MPIKEDSVQPNSGRQHPVPQNVMDVEFKVVGDLTVRQLMYLFAGASLVYIFHKSALPVFWRTIFMVITGGLSIAVAFVPYQERGLDKWLVSFIKTITSPTQMVWRKTYNAPAYFISDYAQIIKNEIITLTPAKSRSKLDEYLGQLEEERSALDELEEQRLNSIKMALSNSNVQVPDTYSSGYYAAPSLGGSGANISVMEPEEEEVLEPVSETKPESKPELKSEPVKDFAPQVRPKEQQRPQPTLRKFAPHIEKKPQIGQKNPPTREQMKEIVKSEQSSKVELTRAIQANQPSMGKKYIDRPIMNVPKELSGEIRIQTTTKLPKIIVMKDINELQTKEESLERKITELKDITSSMKSAFENQVKQGQKEPPQTESSRIEFFKNKYEELKREQADIHSELAKNTERVSKMEHHEEKTQLEKQVEELLATNKMLKSQLAQIQQELEHLSNPEKFVKILEQQLKHPEQPKEPNQNTQTPQPQAQQSQQTTQMTENKIHIFKDTSMARSKQSQTNNTTVAANIINGTVKDKDSQLLEGAVVIIKDSEGDAVRALKTNKLGQFRTQTPMPNGNYTVQVIKGGQKFDIISVTASGKPLDPIYFVGYE